VIFSDQEAPNRMVRIRKLGGDFHFQYLESEGCMGLIIDEHFVSDMDR